MSENPSSIRVDLLKKQEINGILLLDKPQGKSAHQALSLVKRLFSAKKAGHTGTLDPIATGMLPVCFGEATKFSQFLLNEHKHYWVQAKLGIKTQTGDSEGDIVSQCQQVPSFTQADIDSVLARFQGALLQEPPSFSALKHQGKPLYYWARKGIEIKKAARAIYVYALTRLAYQNELLTLHVHCSKGTYIRKLIEDIGDVLGCGAHMTALRRLQVSTYQEDQMITIEALQALTQEERLARLLPMESSLPITWPSYYLSEEAAFFLLRGIAITIEHEEALLMQCTSDQKIRLFLKTNRQFIGIGRKLNLSETESIPKIAPYRLINTRSYV